MFPESVSYESDRLHVQSGNSNCAPCTFNGGTMGEQKGLIRGLDRNEKE